MKIFQANGLYFQFEENAKNESPDFTPVTVTKKVFRSMCEEGAIIDWDAELKPEEEEAQEVEATEEPDTDETAAKLAALMARLEAVEAENRRLQQAQRPRLTADEAARLLKKKNNLTEELNAVLELKEIFAGMNFNPSVGRTVTIVFKTRSGDLSIDNAGVIEQAAGAIKNRIDAEAAAIIGKIEEIENQF